MKLPPLICRTDQRSFHFFCYVPVNFIKTDENYVYCLVDSSCKFFTFFMSFQLNLLYETL